MKSIELYPVDTSIENLKNGVIKVFNLSSEAVVLNADGAVYPLNAKEGVDVDIHHIEKNRLKVALALKEDDGFKLVYRRIWSMHSSVRGVYFIYTLNGDLRHWYMRNIICESNCCRRQSPILAESSLFIGCADGLVLGWASNQRALDACVEYWLWPEPICIGNHPTCISRLGCTSGSFNGHYFG